MNSKGKVITALAAGLAIGGILGVLFAPDKGSETRKKINEQGKKMAEDLKDKFRKGREKFDGMKEDIEETVKERMKDFA